MNDRSFRTRNPWLVVPWAIGLMILLSLPQIIFLWGGGELPGWESDDTRVGTTTLVRGLLTLIAGIMVTVLVLRFLWRRPMDWLRLPIRPRGLLPGFLWGILAPLPPLAILHLAGLTTIARAPLLDTPLLAIQLLAGFICFWLLVGAAEEIVFRGMIIREVATRLGWIPAWLIGGAVFGIIHFQPSFGLLGAIQLLVGGILVSGLFLSLYLRGSNLWIPIGFHLGWNFCLTNLIGAPISGSESTSGLWHTTIQGPTLLSGGEFGMEVSAITMLCYMIYALIALRLPRKGGAALLSPEAPG